MNEEAKETFLLTKANKEWIENNIRENDEENDKFYKNWPDFYKMNFYRFANPETITPYNFTLYNYENVYIFKYQGKPSIFYNGKFNEKNVSELLYIISYFSLYPCLAFSKNREFTCKMFEITAVETIDFTDMLQIRYFNNNHLNRRITMLPKNVIFKMGPKNYIIFNKLSAPYLLGLYHASLFQKDIAAKCIFLFRIIDCINANYKSNLSIPGLIEDYYAKVQKYRFQPIYVNRFCINNNEKIIEDKDKKYINYFQLLKKESQKIYRELTKKYNGLRLGEIIYNKGRSAVAHGREITGPNPISLHNFEKDLLEINDINIILELIARVAIEEFNPELKNHIEIKKSKYDEHNY